MPDTPKDFDGVVDMSKTEVFAVLSKPLKCGGCRKQYVVGDALRLIGTSEYGALRWFNCKCGSTMIEAPRDRGLK